MILFENTTTVNYYQVLSVNVFLKSFRLYHFKSNFVVNEIIFAGFSDAEPPVNDNLTVFSVAGNIFIHDFG